MPHIPGHPAKEENNQESGGLPYLMPDEVEEDTMPKSKNDSSGLMSRRGEV